MHKKSALCVKLKFFKKNHLFSSLFVLARGRHNCLSFVKRSLSIRHGTKVVRKPSHLQATGTTQLEISLLDTGGCASEPSLDAEAV